LINGRNSFRGILSKKNVKFHELHNNLRNRNLCNKINFALVKKVAMPLFVRQV